MSQRGAIVAWERGEQVFLDLKYSRRHTILFDGGVELAASAAPTSLPPPLSDAVHHAAHASCFIAASIGSHVAIQATLETR